MGRKKDSELSAAISQEFSLNKLQYAKNNKWINTKGKCSLFGHQLFSIGLMFVEYDYDEDCPVAEIYVDTIKDLCNIKGGSVYERIKKETQRGRKRKTGDFYTSLMDYIVYNFDDELEEMAAHNVITDAKYKNGILKLFYNKRLWPLLQVIKKNGGYTLLSTREQMSLRKATSFKLYEYLKEQLDLGRCRQKTKGSIEFTCGLVELQLELGLIDAQYEDKIEKAVNEKGRDSKEVEEILRNSYYSKSHADYKYFNSKVLKKAVEEINSLTSLRVRYKERTSGRGGKVYAVRFTLDSKDRALDNSEEIIIGEEADGVSVIETFNKSKAGMSSSEMDAVIDKIDELFSENLKVSEIRKIAEAADYDFGKVKEKYMISRKTKTINNFVGWMIQAIKEDYQDSSIRVINSTSQFSNFEQRSFIIDDELEAKLLDN